jgi:hypothetical protein
VGLGSLARKRWGSLARKRWGNLANKDELSKPEVGLESCGAGVSQGWGWSVEEARGEAGELRESGVGLECPES